MTLIYTVLVIFAGFCLTDSGAERLVPAITEYFEIVLFRNIYYVHFQQRLHPIPDNDTLAMLKHPHTHIKEITGQNMVDVRIEENKPFPQLKQIPTGRLMPDDSLENYIRRSTFFNGNLLQNISRVGSYVNPSITLFRGRLLMVVSLELGFTGSRNKPPSNTIEFRWLNSTEYPFAASINNTYLGVDEVDVSPLNRELTGQDPRVLVTNDSYFQILFTSLGYVTSKAQRMGVAEVQYVEERKRLEITYERQPILVSSKNSQKNWSPFRYRNQTLLIQSINPFTVSMMSEYGGTGSLNAMRFSKSSPFQHNRYGDLRGGTNVVLVGDRYLSFYHIRTTIPHNKLVSYLFGAYTFTSEPPFRVLSVSPMPIIPRELYTGPWGQRFIDYCVFPMSIFVDGKFIHLSFGYQDRSGMMAKIVLEDLLNSLVPVTHFDDGIVAKWER